MSAWLHNLGLFFNCSTELVSFIAMSVLFNSKTWTPFQHFAMSHKLDAIVSWIIAWLSLCRVWWRWGRMESTWHLDGMTQHRDFASKNDQEIKHSALGSQLCCSLGHSSACGWHNKYAKSLAAAVVPGPAVRQSFPGAESHKLHKTDHHSPVLEPEPEPKLGPRWQPTPIGSFYRNGEADASSWDYGQLIICKICVRVPSRSPCCLRHERQLHRCRWQALPKVRVGIRIRIRAKTSGVVGVKTFFVD